MLLTCLKPPIESQVDSFILLTQEAMVNIILVQTNSLQREDILRPHKSYWITPRTLFSLSLHWHKGITSQRLGAWWVRPHIPDGALTFPQITMHAVPDLVQSILYPAALDTRTQIADDLDEMRTQLRKQVQRLRDLRVKKTEEPGTCHWHPNGRSLNEHMYSRCILWSGRSQLA